MNPARMREVMKKKKAVEGDGPVLGEFPAVPKPPPPPPASKAKPITVVPPQKNPGNLGKRQRVDNERPASPSTRLLQGSDKYRVDDPRSLRVALKSAMALINSSKLYSDVVAKKAREFAELEEEHSRIRDLLKETQVARRKAEDDKKAADEALAKMKEDLVAAEASRDLHGQQLNKVSKEHDQYVQDMNAKIEDLEYQQASAFVRGYETAIEHVKFKTPDYDFTDLRWDAEIRDGRLVVVEEGSTLQGTDAILDILGDQEVQQEVVGRAETPQT